MALEGLSQKSEPHRDSRPWPALSGSLFKTERCQPNMEAAGELAPPSSSAVSGLKLVPLQGLLLHHPKEA